MDTVELQRFDENEKKNQKNNYSITEREMLSINLAILTSLFDSPPQSCVVSVIWTCEKTMAKNTSMNSGFH